MPERARYNIQGWQRTSPGHGGDSNGGSLACRLHTYDGEGIKWAASRELQMVMYGSGGGLLLVGVRPAIAHNSRPILVSGRSLSLRIELYRLL